MTASSSFDADAAKMADSLHEEGKFDEIFALLSEAYTNDTNADITNVELLWRYARACFDQQEAASDKETKEKLVRQGLDLTDKVIKQDDGHFAGHKWRAILLSELGNYTSIKEKIADSFVIRDELELALKAQPDDSTTLFSLGKWCQAVASVGWMQRKIALALFAKPPQATYQDAIGYFQRAFEILPSKRSAYAMGECFHALKQRQECREWMQKCLDCSTASAVEKQLDERARNYL